jgi:hypothetical protein
VVVLPEDQRAANGFSFESDQVQAVNMNVTNVIPSNLSEAPLIPVAPEHVTENETSK